MISTKYLLLLALSGAPFIACAAEPAPASVKPLDRIVAVVNTDVITRLELDERVQIAKQQIGKQGAPLPPTDVLERQLLERMILDRAQLQLAQETGVKVDDVLLDKTILRIAQENKLTFNQFRAQLEKEGISYSKFREDIRKEVQLSRLREREVDNRVNVSEGEIDNLLSQRQSSPGSGGEFNLAHILVRAPEQASPEQLQKLKAKAERARSELDSGKDFRLVAASYSDAADALEGGVLGWRASGQMPGLFMEAINKLKDGEYSPVLRSANGFHVIKLLAKRGAGTPQIIQQTRARHILVKVNEVVSDQDAKHRILGLRERLENGANFADLARLSSEDASASRGGDLNWLSPGDTVPEFEQVMNALAPGKISEPVRSPFGWHLIEVQERRSEDVSKERQRAQARQEIRSRKSEENYQEWLRQIRDRAYVEYRLDEK
jgi:peptidyl-prolyl cis-trans isomerase SurA